jgi:hypothetical protein
MAKVISCRAGSSGAATPPRRPPTRSRPGCARTTLELVGKVSRADLPGDMSASVVLVRFLRLLGHGDSHHRPRRAGAGRDRRARRSGNAAGLGTWDSGLVLVLDLGAMYGVRLAPARRVARVGAGCTRALLGDDGVPRCVTSGRWGLSSFSPGVPSHSDGFMLGVLDF